ncbi:FFLEELY motif protein [Alteromonas lipolytica]|uniref:DUF8198 domain-containing protein n=1 Tax=Alteromonas lipolytica TaxID=1856405 RepID=A0A1E8FG81_9ALTE|nr:hypothetical protein [Alteromonas lipolytica]OFI34746.1 hypothetical protein BFC17_14295 [Alteromonas lipolytica]GGF53672.1 hypothetical protein GCM10011338_02270 [Alteromonas lipolytica]
MVDEIITHLRQVNARRSLAEQMQLLAPIQALQQWQCQRLLATHAELAKKQSYAKAMDFFVEELYGPKDFSQRDADLMRVIPKLAKALPNKAMHAIEQALWLNALSFELDMAVAQALEGKELNRDTYALAYRQVGRGADRAQQIRIVAGLGEQLADVVKIPGIGLLIKLSRRPAKMAGLLSMHEFLERGFVAFKDLGDVKAFIEPVIATETQLNQQLLNPDIDLTTENPLPYV